MPRDLMVHPIVDVELLGSIRRLSRWRGLRESGGPWERSIHASSDTCCLLTFKALCTSRFTRVVDVRNATNKEGFSKVKGQAQCR